MACEKEFLPLDERCVYCSEAYAYPVLACSSQPPQVRRHDTENANASVRCRKYDQNPENHRSSSKNSSAAYYPYYSPGDAEPRDIIPRASPSRPSSTYYASPSAAHQSSDYSSAISALRSLTLQPPSPPSPTALTSGMWPFRGSGASPNHGYTRGAQYSSTYDSTYSNAGYTSGYGYGYNYSSSGMDRPLPSRRPGGYSRPKSIELVTPMAGR